MRGWKLLTLATAMVGQACAGAAPSPSVEPPPGQPSLDELAAIYEARNDSVLTVYTPADASFMTGMIHHHAQALVMAGWAPTHGASPTLQTLSARIVNAQRDEIATMQRWLEDRGEPVPHVHAMEAGGMPAMADSDPHMPGMLSPEQMRMLDTARGADFDRLFLRLMIQHHRGAVEMVEELFATDGGAEDDTVFKIASDIQVDQRTEIARMQRMLDAMPDA